MKKTLLALTLAISVGCSQQTAEQHIVKANEYLAENNNQAALIELKNAVQIEPRSAEARFALGQMYLREKQYESAEKELNRAMEYGYDASKVVPMLSQTYKRTGADVALSKLEHDQSGLSNSEKIQVGFAKLTSLVRLEKKEQARLLIENLRTIDTNSFYKPLVEVYADALNENYDAALSKVAKVREMAPLEPEPIKTQGQLYLHQGKMSEAAAAYSDYLDVAEEDRETQFLLANLLVETGEMEAAKPHVKALMKISESNPLLNKLMAVISASEKQHAESKKYAEVALQQRGTDPVLRLLAGYSAYEEKDFASAHKHLSFVASDLPDNHPGLRLLAASQLQLGLNNEVSEVMERIAEPSEQDAMLFSKAGYELMRAGYVKQAEKLVQKSEGLSSSAEDLARLGILQLSLNKVEGLVNLEQAIAKSPKLVSARNTLAVAYLTSGQLDKADDLADKWLLDAPNDPQAHLLKGSVFAKKKAFDKAEQAFKQASQLDEDYHPARMELINLYLKTNKPDMAKQVLAALLKKAPDYAPAIALNYMQMKQQGEGEKALAAAKQAYSKDPSNRDLQLVMGRIYTAEQQHSEALQVLNDMPEDASSPDEFWILKSHNLLKTNQIDKADAFFDKWLSFKPNNKQAVMGKLFLIDARNEFAEGVELTERFLKQRDDIQIQTLRAYFLVLGQNTEAGQKAYDDLPADVKQLPIAKSLLARLQVAKNDFSAALGNAEAAYKANANRRNLLLMVYILEKLEQQDRAYTLLSDYVAEKPQDKAAAMVLAERQINRGDQEAIASYRDLVEKMPNNFIALNNLAYLLSRNDQVEQAQGYAERAVEIQPDNAAALDTLAQILVKRNKLDDALALYDRAINSENLAEEIQLNYIETLLAADQRKRALRRIEEIELKEAGSKQRISNLREKYAF